MFLLMITADGHASLGVHVPLVGRLTGGGNTLFLTGLDVTNHANSSATVDFFLDGTVQNSGLAVTVNGSINSAGELVAEGTAGPMRERSSAHFDDFIDAIVKANLAPAEVRDGGFIGSVLFVFGVPNQSGLAAVTARFYNRYGDGFVGVALKGREITTREPQRLVAAVQDTRGTAVSSQVYPNMFINNTGLTPNGSGLAGEVTVEVSATGNTSGTPIGVPITLRIATGQTASINQVLNALQVPAGSETTIVVTARVISGTAAIHGLVSQIDPVTRDGAVFEMSRAD